MSRMSEFYIEVVEMVQQGVSYDSIVESMVAEGLPRSACRHLIDQVAERIEEQERTDEIAAEAYYHGA